MKVEYTLISTNETWWCNSHQRRATHWQIKTGYQSRSVEACCDPKLGGILLPCNCVNLTGIAMIEPMKTKEIRAAELRKMIYPGTVNLSNEEILHDIKCGPWQEGWFKLGKFVLDLENKWAKVKKQNKELKALIKEMEERAKY